MGNKLVKYNLFEKILLRFSKKFRDQEKLKETQNNFFGKMLHKKQPTSNLETKNNITPETKGLVSIGENYTCSAERKQRIIKEYKKKEEQRKVDQENKEYLVLNAKLCRKNIIYANEDKNVKISLTDKNYKQTKIPFDLNFLLAEKYFKMQYEKLSPLGKIFNKKLKKLVFQCSAYSRQPKREKDTKKTTGNEVKKFLNRNLNSSCESIGLNL